MWEEKEGCRQAQTDSGRKLTLREDRPRGLVSDGGSDGPEAAQPTLGAR